MAQEEIRREMKGLGRKRALQIIDGFPESRVLVIGDLMVDHFIWGSVSRISPEAPVPVVQVLKESRLLGGSANVLHNIVSIGGMAAVSGIVGADESGQWMVNEFRKMGIDAEGVLVDSKRPTTIKTRIVAHSQQVVRFDREVRNPVGENHLKELIAYLKSVRDEIQAVIISDYGKGLVSEHLIQGIRSAFSDRKVNIFVDPKRNDFGIYRGADAITPNHLEAARAMGVEEINGPGFPQVEKAANRLIRDMGLKALLITRGEEGMSLFEKGGSCFNIPAAAKAIYDVTGAGDTVIGVFALSVAAGADWREAAVLANHAAGIVVGKVGTATVTREELRNLV